MLIINISAEYQAHRIQEKTVTFIFRNYFIGIHIFTLVSPLDDKESHIIYIKQPKFRLPAENAISLQRFWTGLVQEGQDFYQLQVGMYDLLPDNGHIQ